MIIQIRGTSGSGKTFAMREVMKKLPGMETRIPVYKEGRRNPWFYKFRDVIVLGSYEATCGGCDNIGSAKAVYENIQEAQAYLAHENSLIHYDVLCEGLLLSEDTKWTKQMPDVRCLFLTTNLDTCLARITGRRAEAGNNKPLNPDNTSKRVAVIERARLKLINEGIECRRCSSAQAPSIVLSWLGYTRA